VVFQGDYDEIDFKKISYDVISVTLSQMRHVATGIRPQQPLPPTAAHSHLVIRKYVSQHHQIKVALFDIMIIFDFDQYGFLLICDITTRFRT